MDPSQARRVVLQRRAAHVVGSVVVVCGGVCDRIGVRPVCGSSAPWSEIRLIGEAADCAGWHSVYVPDHFMPHETGNRAAGGPVLESWTCLTGLAMVTRQIRIGTLVLGNTYRHPAVVANMAAASTSSAPVG